ncbi:MAG: SDR family oxidoreductase [Planctomycetes bacterium]|nr:SDR family oxidoreductase [Planctomycetota bacterium]
MTRFRSVFRDDIFQDQVVVVTGGGTGIGRTIAHELGSLGAHVVICGRREEPLVKTAGELEAAGAAVSYRTLNIRDEGEVKEFFAWVVSEQGRLDALVNNAGGQFMSPAESISAKGWHAVVETNLTGTFYCCREAFAAWFGEHGGSIVSIVSEMWRGFPGMAHSGAARAAVVNMTQTLAVEWAARGIRVNAVAPGLIASSGLETYPEAVQSFLEEIKSDTPYHRLGTEAEVSSAVTYLLSPAAAYVSGETMRVDGAASLWRKTWPIPVHDRFPSFEGYVEDSL